MKLRGLGGIMGVLSTAALALGTCPPAWAQDPGVTRVTVAPVPAQPSRPWPDVPKAPAGAPNVILVLLDDFGFSAASAFGGAIPTPHLDRLAARGVRYNRFHTAGVCSPTRASLLTGRNPHQVGFGMVSQLSADHPGYSTVLPKDSATIPRVLKENGYSTAAFGKWHLTPNWEMSPIGPFDRWPTGVGFEYYYGCMACLSEWEPRLYRGTVPVDPPEKPNHQLTGDLVDDAIRWISRQQAIASEKPFFVYLAPSATHAPVHAPREWIDRFKGKFDGGWDKLRKDTFARQVGAGIIPRSTKLTPRPAEIPAWDSLSADERRLFARQMEAYAGYLAYVDHELGRLFSTIERNGLAEETLIMYTGDNGASGEGGLTGSSANMAMMFGHITSVEEQLARIDDIGSEKLDTHFAAGWAWAMDTPFPWMKQVTSHFGATRNGLVVSWPGRTSRPGAIRQQFAHVNDIAPTIYAAAGIERPRLIDGVEQKPLEGKSFLSTLTNPAASEFRTTQYFLVYDNIGIYKDGWMAGLRGSIPWENFQALKNVDGKSEKWELYDIRKDFSQAEDLSAKRPDILQEMKAIWIKEGERNNALPLMNRFQFRPPQLVSPGKTRFSYMADVNRIPVQALPNITNRSFTIDTWIAPVARPNGVIVAVGGRYGGFALFAEQGRLTYVSNNLGVNTDKIIASEPLPDAKSKVSIRFVAHVAGDRTKPMGLQPGSGNLQILINDKVVGEKRLENYGGFQLNETFDLGTDTGSSVTHEYKAPFSFNGSVEKAVVEVTP